MLKTEFPLGLEDSLDQNDISRRCLLDVRVLEMKRISSGNPSVSELIWSLLYSEFLIRSEFGMSWKEGEFSIDFILNAFLGITFIKRFIVVSQHLKIVFTATDITSISCHRNFRLDLTCPDHDGFHNHKRTDLI